MKKIAIVFPPSTSGGVFQYALSIAENLLDSGLFTIIALCDASESKEHFSSLENKVQFIYRQPKKLSKSAKLIQLLGLAFNLKLLVLSSTDGHLQDQSVDLTIIPTPFSMEAPKKIPFITSIPDMMHRYYPDFPEYDWKARLTRDISYGYYAKNAVLVITDSNQGAKDVAKFLKTPINKTFSIPFVPPDYIFEHRNMSTADANKTLSRYNLPDKFLFYPAQFWHHKNHLRLIQSLALIKKEHELEIPLVLAGSSKGQYQAMYEKIATEAEKLGLAGQIYYLGYVSDSEMAALYKKSAALVFPTLIGPTSIPPLEAIVMGTPVLCSNLFSMPEQLGDAALLFNPFDVRDMAEKIFQIWNYKSIKERLQKEMEIKRQDISRKNYAQKWVAAVDRALEING